MVDIVSCCTETSSRYGAVSLINMCTLPLHYHRSWMVFYQCWTVGQASVFGVFVACLSKGRKLWELALYCYVAPLLVMLLWASLWGGVGMRQARQAMELESLGELHYNNSAHFLADGSDLCYNVPQTDVTFDDFTVFQTDFSV
jgi:choline-glycine betaine transporter